MNVDKARNLPKQVGAAGLWLVALGILSLLTGIGVLSDPTPVRLSEYYPVFVTGIVGWSVASVAAGVGVRRGKNGWRVFGMCLAGWMVVGSIPPRDWLTLLGAAASIYVWVVLHRHRDAFPRQGTAMGLTIGLLLPVVTALPVVLTMR